MPRRPSVTKEQVQSHPVLAGGHVVLMSAENPGFPEAATFQGADAMQQSLENQGLEYEPTRGKYGKPESSFIVHINDPAHIEACLGMAKRFGQESVVYSSGGKHQLVWTNGTHEGQATPPSEGHDFYDAEPEDNYTMIPGPNGQPHGFMALHLNFNDPPAPFNPNGGGVAPPEAAKAVVKAAVEAYEDILLGLRLRELAKADEKAAARGPQVHTFKTTARAYDASQTSEDIHDGDILHVPSEGVTGFLMGAWPVAVKHGETGPGSFHQLDPNGPAKGDWKAVDGGKWNPSVELAHKVHAGEHPAPQPGINDTVAGVWQEREAMKSEKTMKLTDLIKSQVAKAPAANGGAIKVGKAEAGSAKPGPAPCSRDPKHSTVYAGDYASAYCRNCATVFSTGLDSEGKKVGEPGPHKGSFVKGPLFGKAEKKPHYGSWKEAAAANSKRVIGKGTRPSPEESALDEGLSNPMDTEKAEVHVNKGNLKANGGRIAHHSVWKKAEVATAPEANGGAISVGKKELVPAGNRKANGGKIRLGKQEWVIDLKATGHDEKRVIEKDPVKGAKGFEEPKKQDRPEESSATGGSIDTNKPKKGPKQGPAGPDILKPETSPGGKQDLGDGGAVKGKGDAKGGGTDIFDSVKGKKSPAKDSVIEKAEGSPAAAGAKATFTQRATKPSSPDAFKAESAFGREESSSPGEMTSDDEKVCPACGGESHLGGVLGDRKHFNCHGCGMWFSHKPGSDTAKAEGMKAPKAPGAAPAGVKAMSAQPGGTSPGRHGAPKAGVGNKPSLAASEKQDISGVPSAPSSGPAGNTAITSVDTVTKSETALRMAELSKSLSKAFGEFGKETFGRAPLPGAPAGTTGVAAKIGAAPAAQVTTAALKKPMGVQAAAKPAGLASPAKPATGNARESLHAALNWNPSAKVTSSVPGNPAGRQARVAAQDAAMMGGKTAPVGKVTVKKEVVSAPPANGGKVTVGKNEKLAEAAKLNAEMSPKDDVPVQGAKKMKKEELCKGCGKLHKAGPCAA